MPTTAHHTSSTDDLENRSMVLPNADPQIVLRFRRKQRP